MAAHASRKRSYLELEGTLWAVWITAMQHQDRYKSPLVPDNTSVVEDHSRTDQALGLHETREGRELYG